MKLTNLTTYPDGWCLDIIKLRKRSVIELSCDTSLSKVPSILLQIGPDVLLDISLGLMFCFLTFRIGARHFDD